MFYSWPCLSRLGGGRSRRCGGLWGRQSVTQWPAWGSRGGLGTGRGPWSRTGSPLAGTPATSAAMLRTARHVLFTLLSVCVFTGCLAPPAAAASHNLAFGLATALFSLWTLGLWTGSHTWSPGAGFASISVTDSLGPRTLGLSFPICHITRWTVWQMFFGSKRVSSNDVQCQSPEYKADSSGGPGHTWLKGPPPLALLLPWKLLQFGGWGVPSGPPLASSAGRKATGCVVCCVLTQRTPRCPDLGWSSLLCSRTWTPCDRLARWEKLSTLGVRLPLPTAHPSGRGDSVVTPLPPLWPDPAGHFPHLT